MSLTSSARDRRASELLEELFKRANPTNAQSPHLSLSELDALFSITVWGFRELLLVIVVARLLDSSYQATKSLYACNPRSLFEGPIRSALAARGIPHRQSGPLNVAKATESIDSKWAAQRRPQQVAALFVELTRRLETLSSSDLEQFAVTLVSRFLQEATRIASLTVTVSPNSDPVNIYQICQRLIEETPDEGNTPQRIVGYLLESYHDELKTGVTVAGHTDRASTTNTTSKKPGDILETLSDGTIIRILEVTVKRFDEKRVEESFKSISTVLGSKHSEVIVICREEDAPEFDDEEIDSVIHLGTLRYRGLIYHFVEIYEWIMSQLINMPPTARTDFHMKLQNYIAEPNTSEKVKRLWSELHTKSDGGAASAKEQ